MANIARSAPPAAAQKTVAEALQDSLIDLVDLSMLAKQAHWNVVGPRFRSIHEQLDEAADSARRFSDVVAERVVAIGVPAEGRAVTVAKESALPDLGPGWISDDDAITAFAEIYDLMVERIHRRIGVINNFDPVSADLLISLTAEIERARWMWRAQIAPKNSAAS